MRWMGREDTPTISVILDGWHIALGGIGETCLHTAVHLFVKIKSSEAITANTITFHR